jgi:hypothetical protein
MTDETPDRELFEGLDGPRAQSAWTRLMGR